MYEHRIVLRIILEYKTTIGPIFSKIIVGSKIDERYSFKDSSSFLYMYHFLKAERSN